MKHLRQIQKTFVRQLGRHDCGAACICMILKFAGKNDEAASIRATALGHELSVLDLRNLVQSKGLQARCVQMDLEFLAGNPVPCILHVSGESGGNHFQVCYGSAKRAKVKGFLMGDPARGIHFVSQEVLNEKWKSRAAVYFDDLPAKPAVQAASTWHLLLSGDLVPAGLLVGIPLLSIFTAVLGIAWSWALQRGINNSIAERKDHWIAGVVILLCMVTMARNLFSFIRQQLMIRMNTAVNRHLMFNLMRKMLKPGEVSVSPKDQSYFKSGVDSMIKMQQGVSAFLATLLSEGSILILVLAGLCYQSLIIGLINIIYLCAIITYSLRKFPEMLFDHSHLNELSGSAEKMMLQDLAGSVDQPDLAFAFHSGNHSRYLDFAGKVSSAISRNSLVQECLGTANVICIFIYGILKLRDWSLSYSAFMIIVILSYFITALMPKICSSLFVVYEGIEASRQCPID